MNPSENTVFVEPSPVDPLDATLPGEAAHHDAADDSRDNPADGATLPLSGDVDAINGKARSNGDAGADAGDDATLAGDGTQLEVPEGTLDGDRTLPGEGAIARDDIDLGDRTLVEDRTVPESPHNGAAKPGRRRTPEVHDTHNDATLAGDEAGVGADDRTLPGDSPASHDDATLAGDAPVRGTLDDDRTIVGQAAPVDDDRTVLSEPVSEADPDRTVMGAAAAVDHDRTILGDEPPVRGETDDRTILGDAPPDHDPRGPDADATAPGDHAGAAPASNSTAAPHASPGAAAPGDVNYDLVEDFARGGMGKIWRALDKRIKREVAFKELLPNALRNPVVVERFLKEAQITGQLEHPGVVPIYDLGWQRNGTPFYSMKLVRGSTFKKSIEAYHALPKNSGERRLAFVKVLQQFIQICQTMGYAHERHVLHRDLKPLNIMVGDFGETLVLDWGLARLMNDPDASPLGAGPIDEADADADGRTEDLDPQSAGTLDAGTEAPRGAADDRTIVGDAAPPPSRAASSGSTQSGGTQSGKSQAGKSMSGKTQSGATQGGTQGGGTQSGVSQTGATRRASVVTDYESAGSRTLMGAVMGTPAYMPPEQAVGRLDQLDARSDNYSLGAILYEILTNRAPIAKDKLPAMLKAVIEGKVVPPRQIDPTIPPALEAVCMKALSTDKANRYASAMTLARELEMWLADEPVSAYQEPWHVRLGRWMRRHRTLVTTTGAVVALSILGGVGWNVAESRRVASIERGARARIADAQAAIEQKQLTRADELLREAAGQVAAEPTLAGLRTEVRNSLDNVAKLVEAEAAARVATLRTEVRQLLVEADNARAPQDLDRALAILNEARGKLASEPRLKVIADEVQAKIAEVTAEIAQRDARENARKTFVKFQQECDEARFYGSFFLAGSVDEQRQAARTHGLAAMAAYGLDKPDAALKRPEFVTDAQFDQIRENAFEVLLILADVETALADPDDAAQRKAGATASLGWIERAKTLGIESKILHVRAAYAHEIVGDEDKARAAAEAAEATQPSTALDFYLLGQDQRFQHHLEEATELYQQALRADPNYFWALQNLGLCHLTRGQADAAAAAYTAAVAIRPDEAICYLTRAIAFSNLRQFPAALADLKKAEELKARPYDLNLNRGGVQYAMEDFKAAIASFEAASKLRPDQSAPHRNLATVYRIQADLRSQADDKAGADELFAQALDELELALDRSGTDAVAHAIRGDIHMRLGREEEAIADFRRAALREFDQEKRATSFKEIGRIHHRAKRYDEAVKAYRQSAGIWDQDAETHRLLAEAHNSLNQLEQAEEAWKKYLELGKPVGDVYRGRGLARAARGQYRDAMNDYTRALELEPSPNMLTRRGWAYILKANQLALDDFEEATKLNPDDPDGFNGRGYAKAMLGDHAGAASDAEEAVKKAKAALGKPAGDWQNFYNAATIFAQAVDQVGKDKKLSAEEREAASAAHTKRALVVLGNAVTAAGAKSRALLQKTIEADTALDPIRDRPEFLKIFPKKDAD